MKVVPVNFTYGGMALEIVAETPVETALLKQIFAHGAMDRGDGKSLTGEGGSCGFYLIYQKPEK